MLSNRRKVKNIIYPLIYELLFYIEAETNVTNIADEKKTEDHTDALNQGVKQEKGKNIIYLLTYELHLHINKGTFHLSVVRNHKINEIACFIVLKKNIPSVSILTRIF